MRGDPNDEGSPRTRRPRTHEDMTYCSPRRPTRRLSLADAVRVGDQVSTCGFSAQLNRSQSRYHRRPDWPHVRHLDFTENVWPESGIPSSSLDTSRRSIRYGDDPAELAIGQLHQSMTCRQFRKHLPFDFEGMWTGNINEHDSQILALRGLRSDVDRYRYGPSIRLPALHRVKTCESQ
jgi:hypothetical protein